MKVLSLQFCEPGSVLICGRGASTAFEAGKKALGFNVMVQLASPVVEDNVSHRSVSTVLAKRICSSRAISDEEHKWELMEVRFLVSLLPT